MTKGRATRNEADKNLIGALKARCMGLSLDAEKGEIPEEERALLCWLLDFIAMKDTRALADFFGLEPKGKWPAHLELDVFAAQSGMTLQELVDLLDHDGAKNLGASSAHEMKLRGEDVLRAWVAARRQIRD